MEELPVKGCINQTKNILHIKFPSVKGEFYLNVYYSLVHFLYSRTKLCVQMTLKFSQYIAFNLLIPKIMQKLKCSSHYDVFCMGGLALTLKVTPVCYRVKLEGLTCSLPEASIADVVSVSETSPLEAFRTGLSMVGFSESEGGSGTGITPERQRIMLGQH